MSDLIRRERSAGRPGVPSGNRSQFMITKNNTKEVLEQIGARILSIRRETGLSRVDFAKSINAGVASLKGWETARILIASHALVNLHKAYGVDPTWVLTGTHSFR